MLEPKENDLKKYEFQLVYRKKSGKKQPSHKTTISKIFPNTFEVFEPFTEDTKNLNIDRILSSKEEILNSDVYQSVVSLLKEGLSAIGDQNISEIVCFGLGAISERPVPRFQLALLLCLKELFKVKVHVCDPIFNDNDLQLLKHFQVMVQKSNIEGKYIVKENNTTLVFLPHCPKQLTNNLLWSNWGPKLQNCILICNSFSTILTNCSTSDLNNNAKYVARIHPYVLELEIKNTFCLSNVFNDTSVHVFPKDKLKNINENFWGDCEEPVYGENDLEFISNNLPNVKIS